MGGQDLGWSNSAHSSRHTLPVLGEGPTSALSLPPKIVVRKMKEQFFPVFFQAFQTTYSNAILFERGFEDFGHPQCLMAFPGIEDTCSSSLCVSLYLLRLWAGTARAFMWGCWGRGWNWKVGCCQQRKSTNICHNECTHCQKITNNCLSLLCRVSWHFVTRSKCCPVTSWWQQERRTRF